MQESKGGGEISLFWLLDSLCALTLLTLVDAPKGLDETDKRSLSKFVQPIFVRARSIKISNFEE
jgi:hypothetical protein